MRALMDGKARLVLAAGLFATGMAGCSGSDLNGYHPLVKSASMDRRQSSDTNLTSSRSSNGSSDSSADAVTKESPEIVPVSALAPVNVIDGANVSPMLFKVMPKNGDPSTAVPSSFGDPSGTVPVRPHLAELLIPEKTFQTDAASKALRVSYDDLDLLKVLNLEPVAANAVDLMPVWLKGLDGQRVRLRGFMYPTFESEGIERFVLARDNQICCFGRDPKVYDLVQVDMKAGKTTNYIPATRAFDVVGRFKIEMLEEDGKPFGLYFIEDAQVIDR